MKPGFQTEKFTTTDRRSSIVVFILVTMMSLTQVFSQSSPPIPLADSLSALLKTDPEDTNKLNHLNDLGWELMYQNPDTAILLGKQALELATKIAGSSSAINNLSIKKAAEKGAGKAYGNLGAYYYLKGEYATSLEHHFKSLEIREAINDKDGISRSLNNIGVVYRNQGDHTQALEYYFKALKLNVELGNKTRVAFNLNNIGLVYYDQSDYTKALDYYRKALSLNEEMGNKNTAATNLNNIGIVYYSKGDYPKALENYLKALEVNEELENSNEVSNNLTNIGLTYYKEKNYTMALEYHLKALKLNEELGNKYGIASNLGNAGSVFVEEKKYKEAEEYLLQALNIAEEIEALELIKDNNQTLSTLYSQTNRYELAFKHYQGYTAAKDSLFNDEKSKDIGRLEMQHEIEKVERDRKLAEEEKARIAIQQKNRKDTLQYSGIVVLLLIIGLLVGVLGFVKVKPAMASAVTFFAFLLFFEFLLVLLDPTVDRYSGGEPAYKLMFNAGIAACIFPIHAFFERILKHRLVKK